MKKILTCLLLSFVLSAPLYAQDSPQRELGLRLSGFDDLGVIYKKQIRENTYRRYRLAFGNLGATIIGGSPLINFSAGGAAGVEKRRPITDKLQFLYGTELIASLGVIYSGTGSATVNTGSAPTISYRGSDLVLVTPSVGVGFVLGAMYSFNTRWYASAELIPSVTVNGTFGGGTAVYGIQAGFSSTSVGLTGAYRF